MKNKSEKQTQKKTRERLNLITVVLTVILAVLIVVVIVLPKDTEKDPDQTTPGQTTAADPMAELVIHSVEEQGEWVNVTTSYGNFSYPYAYSDLIVIETMSTESCVAFAFKGNLGESIEPVYTLWINKNTGIYAGALTVNGNTYPVYVELLEADENLDPAMLPSYYAAQETLNDVLCSMEEAGIFTYES